MRWARARRPGDIGRGYRPAPRVPVTVGDRIAAIDPKANYTGFAARACVQPDVQWGGPYRVHRPDGPIKPNEMVVGLTVKNESHTKPLRVALERQYRQARRTVSGSARSFR